jgi:hypothetical protein
MRTTVRVTNICLPRAYRFAADEGFAAILAEHAPGVSLPNMLSRPIDRLAALPRMLQELDRYNSWPYILRETVNLFSRLFWCIIYERTVLFKRFLRILARIFEFFSVGWRLPLAMTVAVDARGKKAAIAGLIRAAASIHNIGQ